MTTAESTSSPILEVENLSVRFGRAQVLRHINMRIERGQTLAIIGESGCGKTVFLKNLIGLMNPTEGRVVFDGENLARLGQRRLSHVRTRYGFLFQQAALFDSMTIEQNVSFPLRQHTRKKPDEIRQIVLDRLAEVGLNPSVLPKKPAELSGGMRKRVGLARALVLEPEVMLYDEPTTGLDPIMSDVINELVLRTRQSHPVTSIIVTHDMRTTYKVADRVVMFFPLARLEEGESQILYDGTPDGIEHASDPRVKQFVEGEAGERLMEMRAAASDAMESGA